MKKIINSRNKGLLSILKLKQKGKRKDIHALLAETISERKKLLQQFEKLFEAKIETKKDIHQELQQTIAGLKKAAEFRRFNRRAA